MKPVVKPDRAPDHTTEYGSCFYWDEMIYVNAFGRTHSMLMSGNETLHLMLANGEVGIQFSDKVKKAYDEWWFEIFENKFLDTSGDKS
jgi:hypothetical protein